MTEPIVFHSDYGSAVCVISLRAGSIARCLMHLRNQQHTSYGQKTQTRLSFLTVRGMLLIPQMHKTPGDASRSQRDDADRTAVVAVENDWLSHQSDGPRLNRILVDDFMHPIPSVLFLNK